MKFSFITYLYKVFNNNMYIYIYTLYVNTHKNVYILLLVEGICTEISYRCLLQFVIPIPLNVMHAL